MDRPYYYFILGEMKNKQAYLYLWIDGVLVSFLIKRSINLSRYDFMKTFIDADTVHVSHHFPLKLELSTLKNGFGRSRKEDYHCDPVVE